MPKPKFVEYLLGVFLAVGILFALTAAYIGYDVAKFVATSQIRIEDGVEIRYSPDHPEAFRRNTLWNIWIIPIIFTGLSLVFAGGSGLALYQMRDRDHLKNRLMAIGHQVLADFVKIENGQVVAEWHNPSDNKKYVFKAVDTGINLEHLPKNHLIPVYIDPKNPHVYYMALPR